MNSKYKISKVIISSGLGGKSLNQITQIKTHFESLFCEFFSNRNQKAVITKCTKANAKFKIRPNTPMGIKITIRRNMAKLINFFKTINPNWKSTWKLDNKTYMFGVSDHRSLKLQRYNSKTPEYGFNVLIVIEPIGSRLIYRRINPIKLKAKPNLKQAQALLDQLC